ncbi:MAG: glycoside hydrolase family 65 protein, partial [Eubacteriales bacterium]|nr:glycoside hydrolase family 65 protein [Eubacteriales bacterium]
MAFQIDPWKVVEDGFDKTTVRLSESLASTGNGYMGMRGNFEEDFTGDTHIGTYIGGVWFPDKTRVGWWKNGYPQYFGKSINAVRLMGFHVWIDGETLDLNQCAVIDYRRELNMQTGIVLREFTVETAKGKAKVRVERFVSLAQKELMAVAYAITPDHEAEIEICPYLDAHVHNLDSNYNETFWEMLEEEETEDGLGLLTKTKRNPFGTPRFAVAAAMSCWADNLFLDQKTRRDGYVEETYSGTVKAGETARLEKYALCFT